MTDVTEFRVADRKVYFSPVIDLFDRSVVAHAWSFSPNLELTNTSLTWAIAHPAHPASAHWCTLTRDSSTNTGPGVGC